MRATLKILKTRLCRVHREVERKLEQLPNHLKPKAQNLLEKVTRILTQKPQNKNKLYALHAPEVESVSKGKARIALEFGVQVSNTTTLKVTFVVGVC